MKTETCIKRIERMKLLPEFEMHQGMEKGKATTKDVIDYLEENADVEGIARRLLDDLTELRK